ncbi:MAG: type II secretion system F family protein [Dehalococcoidia bacterium]|nr:type II secretion system F family protein [Dehalococcoidia bacterium]
MALLVALAVMATITLLIIGLSQAQGAAQRVVTRRLEKFSRGEQSLPSSGGGDDKGLLRSTDRSKLGPFAGILAGSRHVESSALALERAAIPLRVGEYMTLRFSLAAIFFLMTFALVGNLLIALPVAPIGYFLPRWYVNSRRRSRQAKINGQLEEMLTLVANSLKSGYGLMQSFEYASRQLAPPIAIELKRMLQEANLGAGAETAIQALADRISSPDMEMVVTAIAIPRSVGGNLAQTLDNVAYTMRERDRIRGEIKTLTSQQVMTGFVIGALPIFVFLAMFAINPGYELLLFTTTAGKVISLVIVGMEALGIVMMRSMLKLEV